MRHRPSIFWCGLALVGLGFQPAPQQQPPVKAPKPSPTPPAILEGSVRDAQGRAVPDAIVAARSMQSDSTDAPLTARTDAKGAFRFVLKDSGPYTVRADAQGWAGATLERIRPGVPLSVTLSKGAAIQGVVRDGSTGQPVPEARVEARDSKAIALPWEPDVGSSFTITDDQGRYRVLGLSGSLHAVSASARGYGTARKNEARPNSSGLDLYLFPGASVAGVVRGTDGKPVQGAIVRAEFESFGASAPRSDVTRAGGRFEIAGLQPGPYRLVVRHRDFAPAVSAKLLADAGADLGADMALEEGVRVTGRLTNFDGESVPGRVSVAELKGEPVPRLLGDLLRAESGLDGRFRLGPVPRGDHALAVAAPGYSSKRVDARVETPGAEADLGDILLEPGLAIRGLVRDRGGAGISGARLSAFPTRSSGPVIMAVEGRSESDGSFAVSGLSPGSYRLTVRASGYGEATRPFEAGADKAEIVLTPAGAVTGQVVDDEGRPVELFRLASRPAPAAASAGTVMGPGRTQDVTSADGRFTLEDLAEGTHVVTVSAPERTPASISDVRITGGGSTDIGRVRLSAGGTIRGNVTDTSGAPVAGAALGVRGASRDFGASFAPQAVSDTGGAFEIRGAPAGTVEVSATHPNYAEGRVTGIEVDPSKGPSEARVVLAEGGRVEGFVRRRDGRGVSNVAISVLPVRRDGGSPFGGGGPRIIQLRDDGSFAAEHLPSGRLQVLLMNVSGGTYTSAQAQEAEIQNGATASVNFVSQDILVSGRITRSGAPGAGVRVSVRADQTFTLMMSFAGPPPLAQAGPPRGTAVTREDGGYELIASAPGKAVVSVASADGKSGLPSRNVVIPDADAHTLDLDFGGASVTGVVVDAETEAPLAQADVSAGPRRPGEPGSGGRTVSGPDGRFELELDPGEYRVSARRSEGDYSSATVDVDVGTGGAPQIRLALARGVSITGKVVDAAGRGAGNLNVTAAAGEPPQASVSSGAVTLADGSFRIGGLRQEPYTIAARSDVGTFAVRTSVTPGEENLLLTLRRGGQLRVQVVGPDQKPVERANVQLARFGGAPISVAGSQTDAQGAAELMVPAGSLEIRARKDKLEGTATAAVAEGGTATLVIALTQPRDR